MDAVKLLKENWGVIADNIWLLLTLGVIVAASTWAIVRTLTKEQIETLKLRLEGANDEARRAREQAGADKAALKEERSALQAQVLENSALRDAAEKSQFKLDRATWEISTLSSNNDELKRSLAPAVERAAMLEGELDSSRNRTLDLTKELKALKVELTNSITVQDSLKAKLAEADSAAAACKKNTSDNKEKVQFPHISPNGPNILSPAIDSVRVNEVVGVRATVPSQRVLLLKMEGLGPNRPEAAWSWSAGGTSVGWNHELYNFESSIPVQTWTAWEGTADLKFRFHRAGEVTIRLSSDDGETVKKTLRVLP